MPHSRPPCGGPELWPGTRPPRREVRPPRRPPPRGPETVHNGRRRATLSQSHSSHWSPFIFVNEEYDMTMVNRWVRRAWSVFGVAVAALLVTTLVPTAAHATLGAAQGIDIQLTTISNGNIYKVG